jgi:hypothetical protein
MSLSPHSLASTLAQQRIEVIAVAIVICALIFELLRRKRLMERYAILWLAAGITLLVLALWKGLLTQLAHAAGIHYLPSALFAVAFLFVLVMLVHASMTISRLSDQSTILAQRLALLQRRLEQQLSDSASPADGIEDPAEGLPLADELGPHSARVRLLPRGLSNPQIVAERRERDRRASKRGYLIKRDRVAE